MTPDALQARSVQERERLSRIWKIVYRALVKSPDNGNAVTEAAVTIEREIVAPAVSAERERCAVIADEWRAAGHEHDCGCPLCGVDRGISRAIRATGGTTDGT